MTLPWSKWEKPLREKITSHTLTSSCTYSALQSREGFASASSFSATESLWRLSETGGLMRVVMADNSAFFPWSSLSHNVERYKTCLKQQTYDSGRSRWKETEGKWEGSYLAKPQLTCQQDKPLDHYQAAEPESKIAVQETKLREGKNKHTLRVELLIHKQLTTVAGIILKASLTFRWIHDKGVWYISFHRTSNDTYSSSYFPFTAAYRLWDKNPKSFFLLIRQWWQRLVSNSNTWIQNQLLAEYLLTRS